MKKNVLPLLFLLITSCGSVPEITKHYEGPDKPENEIAILTSQCHSECDKAIRSFLGIGKGLWGPHIYQPYLIEINGVPGENSNRRFSNIYNSGSSNSFEIQVIPGKMVLKTKNDYHLASYRPDVEIQFQADLGKKYFIGQALD